MLTAVRCSDAVRIRIVVASRSAAGSSAVEGLINTVRAWVKADIKHCFGMPRCGVEMRISRAGEGRMEICAAVVRWAWKKVVRIVYAVDIAGGCGANTLNPVLRL